jgi:hypothetical protein
MRKLLILSMLSIVLGGCAVQLVAPYDPVIDAGVTKLQTDTENLLDSIVSANLAYKPGYYDTLRIELKVLETRAAAVENNQLTSQQLTLLGKNIDDLETLHKNSLITLDDLTVIHHSIDSNFTSILKLELAK